MLVGVIACACSSSPGTTATTLSAGTRAALKARGALCTLITPADIKAVTGVSVAQPKVGIHGRQTTCNYKAHVLASSAVTQFDSAVSPTAYQSFNSKVTSTFGQTTPVTGLPPGAYSFGASVSSGTLHSVVALVGSTQLMVTGTYPLTQLEALASKIVSRYPATAQTTTTLPASSSG